MKRTAVIKCAGTIGIKLDCPGPRGHWFILMGHQDSPSLLLIQSPDPLGQPKYFFSMILWCNLYFLRISFLDNYFFLSYRAEHLISNWKRIKYPNILLELNSNAHRGTFIYHCYSKKSIKCPIPLIRPFSCRVFREGLRVINFFNLLLTRFLSVVSEALWCSLNTGDWKNKVRGFQ